jgi:hypothetical protein
VYPLSPLEKGEIGWEDLSPLEVLLSSIFSLNVSILLLIIILFYLLFTRFFLSANKDFIWGSVHSLLLKFKFRKESIERLNILINKGESYNNIFIFIFFIIISMMLLIFILLNIYFISELNSNIDSYVEVYNYIHNKCGIDQIHTKSSPGPVSYTVKSIWLVSLCSALPRATRRVH